MLICNLNCLSRFERLKDVVNQRVEESGNISLMNNTIQDKLTALDENHRYSELHLTIML